MKKIILAFVLSTAVLAACGNTKNELKTSSTKASSTEVAKESSTEETSEESSAESSDKSVDSKKSSSKAGASDGLLKRAKAMTEYIEAESMEELYEQSEPITIKQGELTVSIDEYKLVKYTEFDSDFEIPFSRQAEEGGVILATISITNDSDVSLYYPTVPDMTFTGAKKAHTNNRTVVEDPADNWGAMVVDSKGEIKAGETVTGTVNYLFGKEELAQILELGIVTLQAQMGYTKPESFKTEDSIGERQKIQLSVTGDGETTASDNAAFLQDKASTDNMGTKTLDMEKKDINDTQTVRDLDVQATLSEYQFTFFEPNEEEASRFKNFETGVVLLTVVFNLENQGDKGIVLSSSSATLMANNGSQRIISQGMLVSYGTKDVIQPGAKGEFMQVFALDQEQYEKIWRDKDFGIKLNLVDEDFDRESVEFDLPK